MPEYNVDNTEQEKSLNFDAIKIGLASPEKIREIGRASCRERV